MKRTNRILSVFVLSALTATAMFASGCGGEPEEVFVPSPVTDLSIDVGFLDSDGSTINDGTVYIHFVAETHGITASEVDFIGAAEEQTISGAWLEKSFKPNKLGLGLDPDDLSVKCSADITYKQPDGTLVTCRGVPGISEGMPGVCTATYARRGFQGIVKAGGTFQISENRQGCTDSSASAPAKPGNENDTGESEDPLPSDDGESPPLVRLLTPQYRNNSRIKTYERRGGSRPGDSNWQRDDAVTAGRAV
jgi:hypothetical protein